MRLTITDRLTNRTAQDGQAVAFAVSVYTDTVDPWVLVAPTSLRYRIDDTRAGNVIDWTTITPASTATITVTGAQNTLAGCADARRLLVVEADHGLSTQCVATRAYNIENLAGIT